MNPEGLKARSIYTVEKLHSLKGRGFCPYISPAESIPALAAGGTVFVNFTFVPKPV